MNKTTTTIIVVIVILAVIVGAWWMFFQGGTEEPTEETEKPGTEETAPTDTEGEESTESGQPTEEEESEDVEEEGVSEKYEEAEETTAIGESAEFNEIMREVFAELDFENEPKLVSTGGITRVVYVADRPLTVEDVQTAYDKFKDMEDYEVKMGDQSAEKHVMSLSGEIAGENYSGNLYVAFWLTEGEEEKAQVITVKTL